MNFSVKAQRLSLAPKSTPHNHLFTRDEVVRFQDSRPEYLKNNKPVKATAAHSSVGALSELCVDPELEKLIAPLNANSWLTVPLKVPATIS